MMPDLPQCLLQLSVVLRDKSGVPVTAELWLHCCGWYLRLVPRYNVALWETAGKGTLHAQDVPLSYAVA